MKIALNARAQIRSLARLRSVAFVLAGIMVSGGFTAAPVKRELSVKHVSEQAFNLAMDNAAAYEPLPDSVGAGVVPHHLTAGPMIAGFLQALAAGGAEYDTVVAVGPNHTAEGGDVAVSLRDWAVGGGMPCDTAFVERVLDIRLPKGSIAVDDARMENDHAVSNLIPFIAALWPDAAIAPLLVSRTLSYEDAAFLAKELTALIMESEQNILLLCSVDFSHGLSPKDAARRDAQTIAAINKGDCPAIYRFTNENLDSPAALIIFLEYLNAQGHAPLLLDHADASRFTGDTANGVTSYMILTYAEKR